ncbi:MAG TPA: class I SAM-dependent methyltransferase [Phycisphaerae bacterium]|nr:class I SAM-dependent methyltransferase [Phycisphaerae bacterium]
MSVLNTMTTTAIEPIAQPVDIDRFIDPARPESWSRQMVSLLQAGHYREGYEVLARHVPFVENMLRPYAEHLAGTPNAWTCLHRAMVKYLDHSRPLRVLDVGCAIGCHAIELARKGHETWGVDVLPAMIERGRELADSMGLSERVHLVEGDVRALDRHFDEGLFDAVVACDIVEHLDDDALRQMFSGLKRVMRPGGTLVVQTSPSRHYYWFEPSRWKLLAMLVPMAWMPDRLFSRYVRAIDGTILRGRRGEHVRFYRHEYGHINCMDPVHLGRLLAETGFERVRAHAEHTHPGFKDEGCMRADWTRRLFGRKSAAARNIYGIARAPEARKG